MHTKNHYPNIVKLHIIYVVIINFSLPSHNLRAASAPGEFPPLSAYQYSESKEKFLKQNYQITPIPLQINLATVTATEKASLGIPQKSQPLKIGFGRAMPPAYRGDIQPLLFWKKMLNGDSVATFSVRSPDATGVRLGLYLNQFPEIAELRFFNPNQPTQSFGPFHIATARTRMPFWSPTVDSESIGVEIYLPASATKEFSIKIANIQHLVYTPLHPNSKNLAQIKNSGDCEIDIKCKTTNPDNLSAAVAKILFTRTDGSFLCTGTLLNDKDDNSRIPYFITAHHCISTSDAADTLESYWFFEKDTCNGMISTHTTQFSGGSELLATGEETDFTLLKLKDDAISNLNGIYFAGWSTADPRGLTVIGIHHPMGDVKKWSEGYADSYASWPYNETLDHIQVIWSQGVTEQGSSGSGLFAVTGEQNNQQLYVGGLHGGQSLCDTPHDPDLYGRFDLTYPFVKQWLSAAENNVQANLESPQSGSFESGIGLVRGWVCQANIVEIQIDDGQRQTVAYGTARGDTTTTCGRSNTGFGYTYNWNALSNGIHNLKAFADNIQFANVNFTTTNLGENYLQGISYKHAINDFPTPGVTTFIQWSEPHQNFVIIPAAAPPN